MSRNRRSREFTGVARVAGAVAVVVSLVAGCSADPGSTSSVTVRALWFGKDASGNLASGVTPLTIMETRSQVPQPFRVDLSGMSNAAAGEVWTAAAATASVVATLVSGQDPRYLRPSFSLDESIDGPSAGALTTAGTFAAISRADVRPEVTMTGTILPDGGIGYVGGIPEKIRGAAANGITEVFIPAGQEKSQDPRTRRTVDVVELGRQLGVKVNSARTVWDAYPTLTGRRATAGYSQADPPAVSSQTIDAITAAARQAMQRTRDGLASVPAGSVDAAGLSGAALRTSVTGQLVNAEDELAKGDSFAAYATASAVEQQLLAWQADTSIASSVKTKGVGATREALLQSTADLQRQAEAQFATTTATPTSTLEQLVELPYVAGRDIAVLGTCEKSVEALGAGSATDAALLRRVAVTLAPARYHVDHLVPTLTQALLATPGASPRSPANAVGYLSSYADFMGYAADSDLIYLEKLTKGKTQSDSNFNLDFARFDRDRFQAHPVDPGNQATTVARLAWALHYFMTSTVLVAEMGSIDPSLRYDSNQLNSIVLTDPVRFANQVAGAAQTAGVQDRLLAGANLNSSMLRFVSDWGEDLATNQKLTISDARRRLGLEFQWNSVTLGFLMLSTNINGG